MSKFLIIAICLVSYIASGCASTYESSTLLSSTLEISRIKTMLVAPMSNLSDYPNAEDMVQDALLSALRADESLQVKTWTWAMREWRNLGHTPPGSFDDTTVVQVARVVGVDAVLSGTLLEFGHVESTTFVQPRAVAGVVVNLLSAQDGVPLYSGMFALDVGNPMASARPPVNEPLRIVVSKIVENLQKYRLQRGGGS